MKLEVLQSPYEFLQFGLGTEESVVEGCRVVNRGDDFSISHHSESEL